ncbi:MAG: ArsS family sensor histidine kinase [Campylobacterales bacterium]|nr:ArsS family sensor histidine kinase [Campylobacterales bacterium]
MNKHSLLRLITLFFSIIFILINILFGIAYQHFSKQHELEQMDRFLMADRLFHHHHADVSIELEHLRIRPASLAVKKLLSKGTITMDLPFGTMIEYADHTYFVNRRPPPPNRHFFERVVFEDMQRYTFIVFWMVLVAVDTLVLLFFAYLLRKLLPLHRLKNAIIAFKEGDTHLDVPISGKDEISQITDEFNHALGKIGAMREARSLFLRNILHELKTPIMKGSLTTDCLEPSLEQERLKRIFERMDYLLNEFTRMERFSSGEWSLNLQEYRFVDLLDHACDLLLCEKESLKIRGEESQLILNVDFELFTIALKNLLDNALKYSEDTPILTIRSDTITLCSVGKPLPIEKQTFTKPFNRPYEDSSTGLGLGLYLTHSILQKHGYRLEYHYTQGLNCFQIKI